MLQVYRRTWRGEGVGCDCFGLSPRATLFVGNGLLLLVCVCGWVGEGGVLRVCIVAASNEAFEEGHLSHFIRPSPLFG